VTVYGLADTLETGMIGINKCGLGREGSSHGIGD
jgi:hypothetical protein